MAEPLLEFRDVRACYGEAVVLDAVSFTLPVDGSLAVLGRNGAGKTTLLLAAMGFVRLTRGAVFFRG
jgi:branched-chain amino acid transport system ATP-binding protein